MVASWSDQDVARYRTAVIFRPRNGTVECRFGGEHVAFSPRLRLQAARCSDAVKACQLSQDDAARYWLGSGPEEEHDHRLPPERDPILLSADYMAFKGVDDRVHLLVAYVTLVRCGDGAYDVSGVVHAALRRRGYGREVLETVCRVAHHHFGIACLRAWCETTNVASAGWLESCGFVQVGPPHQLQLPNGRRADALPWQRVEPMARQRCRNLTGA